MSRGQITTNEGVRGESPDSISDFFGLIYLTIWLMDLSEAKIQFEII